MSTVRELTGAARTWLFVPGDRPERFDKAAAAGADIVILDLEDAVPPPAKDDARRSVAAFVASSAAPCAVRVNAVGTPWHDADLEALSVGRQVAVMLPKAQDPHEVAAVLQALPGGSALVALVETALGVLQAAELARAPGVVRLALGTLDLAAELGVAPDHAPAFAAARSALVLASAAGKLTGPVDGVTSEVRDAERLVADLATSVALGFAGKLCIHPAQIEPAAKALSPSPEQVLWAERVLAAVAVGDNQGVHLVDGEMVDRPVLTRAERILCTRASLNRTTGAPT